MLNFVILFKFFFSVFTTNHHLKFRRIYAIYGIGYLVTADLTD